MKNKKIDKGFTLIELLATILIISLVFGISTYYMANIIGEGKDKTKDIALKNIQKSANIYIEEYKNNVIWNEIDETKQACISFNELINVGYLKSEQIEPFNNSRYIIITKNKNNSIKETKIDTDNTCSEVNAKIPIPTCQDKTYNGDTQILINNTTKYSFDKNEGKNAGKYRLTATLTDKNDIWEDNTSTDKIVTCTIKKAIPTLNANSNGSPPLDVGKTQDINVDSNIQGTITAKSSASDYIEVEEIKSDEEDDTKKIVTIKGLSSNQTRTYITITLTPDDIDNYYTKSIVYTIDNVGRIPLNKPESNDYCQQNLTYNGQEQNLLDLTKINSSGYTFMNYYGTNAGTYKVKVQLKYGYTWMDGSTDDATMDCKIKQIIPEFEIEKVEGKITEDNNIFKGNTESGTLMKTFEAVITSASELPGSVIVKPTQKDSEYITTSPVEAIEETTFNVTVKAIKITSEEVNIPITYTPKDTTNYTTVTRDYKIEVITNEFKIKYDCNGGAQSPVEEIVNYKAQYKIKDGFCTKPNSEVQTGWSDLGNNNWDYQKTGTWSFNNNNTTITNNTLKLLAKWQGGVANNEYLINYEYNCGTPGANAPSKSKINNAVNISNPTKSIKITRNTNGSGATTGGHVTATQTFSGWTATGLGATAKRGTASNNINTAWNGNTKTTNQYFKKLRDTTGTTNFTAHWNNKDIQMPTISKTNYNCRWYRKSNKTGTSYTSGQTYTLTDTSCSFTIYAGCTIVTSKLTINPNGGIYNGSKSNTVITGDYNSELPIEPPKNTNRAFYKITCNGNGATTSNTTVNAYRAFTGWTKAGTGTYTAGNPIGTANSKWKFGNKNGSLTANYNATSGNAICETPKREYTITFNANSTGATITGASNNKKTVGYTMNGWYTAASGGTLVVNPDVGKKYTKNTTIYAHWTSRSTTLANVEKANASCYWNTKKDGSGTTYISGYSGYTPTKNITLYARCGTGHWKIGTKQYLTLEEAVREAVNNDKIIAIDTHTDLSNVTISKNVTIDLNGKTVTRGANITIDSGHTVKFTGTGTLKSKTSSTFNIITAKGNAEVEKLTIKQLGTGTVISVTGSGTLKMTSGSLICDTNCTSNTVVFNSTAASSITGGNVVNKSKSTIRKINTGNLTLNCNIYSKGNAITINDDDARGKLTINGGVITNVGDNNTIHIKNGSKTSIEINGGYIWRRGTGDESTITIGKSNTTTINGGTIVNKNGIGINITPGANVTINNGNVITLSAKDSHSALHGHGGKATVTFNKGYLCTNRSDSYVTSKITGTGIGGGEGTYQAAGYQFSNVQYFTGTAVNKETIKTKTCRHKT